MQNHPLKIRVRKIRGGGNYASKYGILYGGIRNTTLITRLIAACCFEVEN